MSLSHACVHGHSVAQIAILSLFTTIQSSSRSKECPTKQSVNEKSPGTNTTEPAPLNRFLSSVQSCICTEHRNGSNKRF